MSKTSEERSTLNLGSWVLLRAFVPPCLRASFWVPALLVCLVCADLTIAQSSSIYKRSFQPPQVRPMRGGRSSPMFASVAASSISAVRLQQPRTFSINDLITIVIHESVQSDSDASLDTEKSFEMDGKISSFPNLRLSDLVDFQLGPSSMKRGQPQLGLEFESTFEGDGQRRRRDTFTARITGRVIDVKPNGTLVVEGRKYLKTDKETTTLLITGTCRPQDVTAGNTILSTQLYDLHLTAEHGGELRKASKKGLLTKLFELIFNF